MKILVIVGHPRPQSFSDALAASFLNGARESGAEVRLLQLRDLQFNPHVVSPPDSRQCDEPDLEDTKQLLLWCDQVVIVFPTWWAGVPALLKGFLDRILTSGFAFEETTGGTGYRGLLGPRSARIITTMDTPWWVYRWIYGRPGELAMKRGTLGFCGFSPVKITTLTEVKHTTRTTRTHWLRQVEHLGRRDAAGPTLVDRVRPRLLAWLQAMRLQFYPMTFLAYTAGALGASHQNPSSWNMWSFLLGYLCLFCFEVSTVFANDLFDIESDRRNEFYGPFSGGSRVLVERKINRPAMGIAAIAIACLAAVAGVFSVAAASGNMLVNATILVGLGLLAIGYTVPPLKLSHRGLGELDVCWTHSFGVILCGYVLQGGRWNDGFPWLLGLPLFFAIFPAILLAGIPDRDADQATRKNTLVVRLGVSMTLRLASVFVLIATILAILWSQLGLAQNAYEQLPWIALPLGGLLLWRIRQIRRPPQPSMRIDGTIAIALLFIFMFAIFILAALIRSS